MSRENVVRVSLSGRRGDRDSRALDDRLAIRFPRLYRRFAAMTMRLPPRSRPRRALLRRQAILGYAAYNRRDEAAALLVFDPEVEAHQAEASGIAIGADLEGAWRGHAGFRMMWAQWDLAWTDSRIEPEELFDLGDSLLLLVTFVARGRSSGAEVRQPAGQLHTLRSGQVVRWQQWWDWDEAMNAAGLSE